LNFSAGKVIYEVNSANDYKTSISVIVLSWTNLKLFIVPMCNTFLRGSAPLELM